MTLPSLLRAVGLHVPRGVSVDGRVLVGRAATAAVSAGTATALLRHTFHGGDDLLPARSAAPWWEDPDACAADVAEVAQAFPGFQLDQSDGGHAWGGTIDTGRGRFAVDVVSNPDGGLPRIVPVVPRILGRNEGRRGFRRPEHLYRSGSLCVADAAEWDPATHTSVTAIAWAAHWYAAYTDWRLGGPWPTDGYRPSAAA